MVAGKVITNPQTESIVIITQRGSIKKMKLSEFEFSGRAKRGLIMLRELKANPHRIVGMAVVKAKDTVYIQTEKGEIESVKIAELRFNDRYSNGSFVIDETEAGKIIELWEEKASQEEA